jgi:SDR family mycofactocin-dependent oxidoreductase
VVGMRRLEGKTAFITGAARGQGRAEAIRLAEEGARIVALDLCADVATLSYRGPTPAELENTASEVRAVGGEIVTAVADVRDLSALRTVWDQGVDAFGPIEVVVANAGISSANWLWETTEEQWEEMLAVNLTGVFHTMKVAAPAMIAQARGGSIIATSSTAGLKGVPYLGAYSASKHGVVGLVRTLANELAEHQIRVNSVHPSAVEGTGMDVTDMHTLVAEGPEHLRSRFSNPVPGPKMAQTSDIAAAVAWLASDDARFVTGAQIPVDLGVMAR